MIAQQVIDAANAVAGPIATEAAHAVRVEAADNTVQRCAAQHFGPWCIEPEWFARAVAAVKAGTFKAETPSAPVGRGYVVSGDGVAVVPMFGQMTKEDSSFGGVNSVRTRKAIRDAANDRGVKAILLHIDSPGGTVAGTGDLAADVRRIDREYNATNGTDGKPVYAYIEDLGASAAYWVASQARSVYANPTAQVGSIGTMTWVEDTSGKKALEGVRVHLIATGKFKGAWLDGVPVTDEYLGTLRAEVEDLNEHFLTGVADGRSARMTIAEVREAADGRVHIAAKAKTLGLIDEVASLDAAMSAIIDEVNKMTSEQVQNFAAAHPDDSAVKDIHNKGHKAGYADGVKAERERFVAIAKICGDRHDWAAKHFLAGNDPDTTRFQVDSLIAELAAVKAENDRQAAEFKARLDAQAKELEKAQFLIGSQAAVNTAAAVTAHTEANEPEPIPDDLPIEERAKLEWGRMSDVEQARHGGKERRYVLYRKAQEQGRVKVLKKPA